MTKVQRLLSKAVSALLCVVLILSFTTAAHAEDANLTKIKDLIKNYYIGEVPSGVLEAATIDEALKKLGDPYTEYFTAKEYKEFIDAIDMKFSGIGINLEMVPEGIKVISVMKGLPAMEAGILEGDIIIKADDQNLSGMTSHQATSYIKGEEGTQVKLVVIRGNELLNFTLVRKLIEEPIVSSEILNDHIGYIQIFSFGENTEKVFKENLRGLIDKNVDSFIIDLRNNSGGYMGTAVGIAEYFIGQEPAVVTNNKAGIKYSFFSEDNGIEIDKPVIFLINEYSASASEILAGAIKDFDKALLIGNTTYGKGVAQSIVELSDGSMLKLTTQNFYTPKENIIHKVGISPDIFAKSSDSLMVAELLFGKAPQEDKGGYAKVKLDGREYEIDLAKASQKQYQEAYLSILRSLTSPEDIVYGSGDGWESSSDYNDSYWTLYFHQYKRLGDMTNVPMDKRFTVSFNEDILKSSINSRSVELVRALTGERVTIDFNFIGNRQFEVIPREDLKCGETYYLVLNPIIKGIYDQKITKGSITKIVTDYDISAENGMEYKQ